jgi:hypothetical protein
VNVLAARPLQLGLSASASTGVEDDMNTKMTAVAALALGGVLVATTAGAQEKDQAQYSETSSRLDAADRSVELTIGMGYEQGLGNIASRQPTLTDLGQAGGAVEASVGYRIIPRLTLGVYGSGGMFGRGDSVDSSTNLYTATAGVKADWHFLPARNDFDPWLSLGSGWRGYWLNDGQGTTSAQGWEIAKLELGFDYRIDRAVAVGPVIGADVSTFFTQSTPASDGFRNITNPQASTFLFAGVQGRFDIPTVSGGSRVAAR